MAIRARFQWSSRSRKESVRACGPRGVIQIAEVRDDGQRRQLGKGPDIAFITKEVSRYSNTPRETGRKPGRLQGHARKDQMVRKSRLVRKVGSIHHAELFALLAVFKSGCHRRFVHLGQQSVVDCRAVSWSRVSVCTVPRPLDLTQSSTRSCEPAAQFDSVQLGGGQDCFSARSCAFKLLKLRRNRDEP